VLAAAGRPQDMPTDGVVDYFNVGSHASSETFQSGPGDLQVLRNPLAHRPSKCLRLYEKSSSLIESESKIISSIWVAIRCWPLKLYRAFAVRLPSDLPLWELFASPTIVEIAAILDRNRVKHTSDIVLARMLEGKRYEHARIKHYILPSEQQFAFT